MIKHKRYSLAIVILILLAIFSASYRPKEIPSNNIEGLKIHIEGWHFVQDIKMDQKSYAALDPKSLIFKSYQNNNGDLLTLTVVYHQNDRWGAHDPIVCYKSQGWEVIEQNPVKMKVGNNSFPANRLVAKKENVMILVYYYWFSSNKKITESRNKQIFDMVLNGLIHGFTESGFVEVSMRINPLNEVYTRAQMNDFVAKLTPLLESLL